MLVLRVIILFLMCSNITGQSYEARTRLKLDLLQNYTKSNRPLRNQRYNLLLIVNVNFHMVKKFDIVDGVLGTYISFTLNWFDEYMRWDYRQYYGNIGAVKLPLADVWVPQLILKNPAGSNSLINKQELMPYNVRYSSKGFASLVFDAYVESRCEPKLKMFPFDKHTCRIEISTFGYDTDEVTSNSGTFDQYPTIDNGEWQVGEVLFDEILGNVYLTLQLSRRPAHLCLNLFFPIVILVGMNLLTFYVPPESGEKTSYSITVFLALTIYMSVIMDVLPPMTDEVPIVSIFLFIHLFNNALVCIFTVFTVYLYHGSNNIPIPGNFLYRFTKYVIRKKGNAITRYSSDDRRRMEVDEDNCIPVYVLNWPIVSRAFDFLSFWVSVGLTLVECLYIFFYILLAVIGRMTTLFNELLS